MAKIKPESLIKIIPLDEISDAEPILLSSFWITITLVIFLIFCLCLGYYLTQKTWGNTQGNLLVIFGSTLLILAIINPENRHQSIFLLASRSSIFLIVSIVEKKYLEVPWGKIRSCSKGQWGLEGSKALIFVLEPNGLNDDEIEIIMNTSIFFNVKNELIVISSSGIKNQQAAIEKLCSINPTLKILNKKKI